MPRGLNPREGRLARLVRGTRTGAARFFGVGLELLFPGRCVRCDGALGAERPAGVLERLPLCDACRQSLGPQRHQGCVRCGVIAETALGTKAGCRLCQNTRFFFDTVIALGKYEDVLRQVVLQMKRPAYESLAMAMGELLALKRRELLTGYQADVIVPIPMYWARRLGRGTNSAEILARCLGRALGVSVGRRVLVRCRNTLPQRDLSPAERKKNVHGAFRVRRGYVVGGARVLLVDDILTTGATCNEAAKMLKQAGAAAVGITVLARASGIELK